MTKRATQPKHRTAVSSNQNATAPVTREFVHSLRGKFKGKGLLKALMAEKKRETKL